MRSLVALAAMALLASSAWSDEPAKTLDLHSSLVTTGIPWKEGDHNTFYAIQLKAELNAAGEGKGTLQFDPNPPVYSEFGYTQMTHDKPMLKIECTLKLKKKGVVKVPEGRRVAANLVDVKWALYEVEGPKLKHKYSLSLMEDERWPSGRLMISDDKGVVRQSVWLADPGPPEPCHPGCFPGGTKIAVGNETRLIETIRVGDSITTISKDGIAKEGKVKSIFVTKNRLLEVQTESGSLVTTETQPLALASGALRAAGELKEGNQILVRTGSVSSATTVKAVVATARNELVYNLVLGEPTLFVANGYLARSKPPAEDTK